MFPHLSGVCAGARADCRWDFRNTLVAVRVNLLVNEYEAFSAGNVNALAVRIVRHVVSVDCARKAGDFLARIHVQYQYTRRFARRNEQAAMRFIERHWEICARTLKFPFLNLAGIPVNDSDLADGCQVDKNLRAVLFELEGFRMDSHLEVLSDFLVGRGVEHADR